MTENADVEPRRSASKRRGIKRDTGGLPVYGFNKDRADASRSSRMVVVDDVVDEVVTQMVSELALPVVPYSEGCITLHNLDLQVTGHAQSVPCDRQT